MLKKFISLFKNKVFKESLPIVNTIPNSHSVVMILGFGGSNPKHFNRLLQHYESIGVSTILHIMPMACPKFIRHEFESDIGIIMHEQVNKAASQGVQLKTHAHVFSQNGTWTLAGMFERALLPKLDKVIFDSTPAFKYERNAPEEAESLSQLITSLYTGKAQYYLYPFTPIVKQLLHWYIPLSIFTDKFLPFKYYFLTNYLPMHRYIRDNFPIVPILFIHSSGDILIPPANVREFMDALKARKVPTSDYLFGDDVSHVSAMYKYPELYFELVDNFLELPKVRS